MNQPRPSVQESPARVSSPESKMSRHHPAVAGGLALPLAALLSCAAASSVNAASSLDAVEVYGVGAVSIDMLDDGADYQELNLSSNSSRLGFRVRHALENLTVFAQIEQGIDISTQGNVLADRDSFVGLEGTFGTVQAGKFNTPFKKARGPANLFGDRVGDLRALARVGDARFDERTPNTLQYTSPPLGDVEVKVAWSVHEGDAAVGDADQTAASLSVSYSNKRLRATAAWEQHQEDRTNGERRGLRGALSYQVNDAFTAVAFLQQVDHDDDTQDAITGGVGATLKAGQKGLWRTHYMMRQGDPDNTDAALVALGYDHQLESHVVLYIIGAVTLNDDNTDHVPWKAGRTTDVDGVAGEDASALSLGMTYKF